MCFKRFQGLWKHTSQAGENYVPVFPCSHDTDEQDVLRTGRRPRAFRYPPLRSTLFVGTGREEMEINPPFRVGEYRAVVDGISKKSAK